MYLCVCTYGHSRSVALSRVLHSCGVEAVAVGHHTSPTWLKSLSALAVKILILDRDMRQHVNPAWRDKVVEMHVGPDRWVNPYHPQLNELLRGLVRDQLGIIAPLDDGRRFRAMQEASGKWTLEQSTHNGVHWTCVGMVGIYDNAAEALGQIPKL